MKNEISNKKSLSSKPLENSLKEIELFTKCSPTLSDLTSINIGLSESTILTPKMDTNSYDSEDKLNRSN